MKKSYFVCFDGPKATGKTTILQSVQEYLVAGAHHPTVNLCEKEIDPYRKETLDLIKEFSADPSEQLELLVCQRLAAGRGWITQNVLTEVDKSSIVLIDRWYPSDAAFRRLIPFSEILKINEEAGACIPDLMVGVTAAPVISWERAAGRRRGLSSMVIHSFEQHEACTEAFDKAIADQGWYCCRNEGSVEAAAEAVAMEIYHRCRLSSKK